MDVSEGEYRSHALFPFFIETTALRRTLGVVIGSKEEVPDWEVGVVLRVVLVGVVHAVGLGALEDGAEPARGADVPMVEVFRDCGEDGVERSGFDGDPQNEVGQGGGDDRIDRDFHWVLIEAGEHFDAPR